MFIIIFCRRWAGGGADSDCFVALHSGEFDVLFETVETPAKVFDHHGILHTTGDYVESNYTRVISIPFKGIGTYWIHIVEVLDLFIYLL